MKSGNIGDEVRVTTKLGRFVASGVVESVFEDSVHVRPAGKRSSCYHADFYNFEIMEDRVVSDEVRVEVNHVLEAVSKALHLAEPSADGDKEFRLVMRKDGSVNVEELPVELKNRILGVKEISDDDKQRVMGAVGEAAAQIFKQIGVKERELYKKVHDIQLAVEKVLDSKV